MSSRKNSISNVYSTHMLSRKKIHPIFIDLLASEPMKDARIKEKNFLGSPLKILKTVS